MDILIEPLRQVVTIIAIAPAILALSFAVRMHAGKAEERRLVRSYYRKLRYWDGDRERCHRTAIEYARQEMKR